MLMGHTISVVVLRSKDWEHGDCVGLFEPDKKRISILRQSKTGDMHTFFHEATHAMMWVLGHRLYTDEQFSDSVGGLLAQLMASAK
jgi:hypothetical protein